MLGQADQMANHLTGRVKTRQPVCSLKSQEKARQWYWDHDWELVHFNNTWVSPTFTSSPHNTHHSIRLSSCSLDSCCGFLLARTQPKVRGMCRGGCSSGAKSIRYSCFSQRTVSGSRRHGAARNMFDTTRQWNCILDSLRVRRVTWDSRREMCGCCHAHSN